MQARRAPPPRAGWPALPIFLRNAWKTKDFLPINRELDLGRTASARFVLAYVVGSALRTPQHRSPAPRHCAADA